MGIALSEEPRDHMDGMRAMTSEELSRLECLQGARHHLERSTYMTAASRNMLATGDHITPLARCARTSSGLPIGIAHISRQRVGYAVTRHVAPVPLAARVGGALLLAVVIGLSAAALLFHGRST